MSAIAAVAAPFGRDLRECALGGYIREPGPGEAGPDLPPGLDPHGPQIERLIALAGETVYRPSGAASTTSCSPRPPGPWPSTGPT